MKRYSYSVPFLFSRELNSFAYAWWSFVLDQCILESLNKIDEERKKEQEKKQSFEIYCATITNGFTLIYEIQ